MPVRPWRRSIGRPRWCAVILAVLVIAGWGSSAAAQCPGQGNCCEANGTPGCSVESCCFDICTFWDPSCCDVAWDQECADLAKLLCPQVCADPPDCPGEGDCFEANGTPGCEDEICCSEVCLDSPFCCDIAWDSACVELALVACDAPCFFCPDEAMDEGETGCVFFPAEIPATSAEIFDGFAAGDRFGQSVAMIGDVDKDGHDDFIVGAYFKTVGGQEQRGRCYIFSGEDGELLWSERGEAGGDQFGFSVAAGGDITGNGDPDVIVGARRNDGGGSNAGRVYAYRGEDGLPLWTFTGPAAGDEVGYAVDGVGDTNGDGRSDIVVSSFTKAGERGRVWLVSGLNGTILETITGDNEGDRLGFSVAGLGDIDGDLVPDFGAGAYQADLNGNNAGLAYAYSGVDGSLLFTFDDSVAGDEFGFSIDGAGDVDDDGLNDVIVGARFADAGTGDPDDNRGQAFVYSSKDGSLLFSVAGNGPGDQLGVSVTGIGDANGDGFGDVLAGAPKADTGQARAFSGADGALLYTITGESSGDDFGNSVDGGGDVDDSGAPDVIVGARFNDAPGNNAGRAYVYLDKDGAPEDNFNGGCFSTPVAVSAIGCGGSVCGTSGYDALTGARDTDWYEVFVPEASVVTWTVTAEFPVEIGIIDPNASEFCDSFDGLSFIEFAEGDACVAVSVDRLLTAGTWWLFVAPQPIDDVECETTYTAAVDCVPDDSVLECGHPGAGSCAIANGTPYCDDQDCCEQICAADPACCDLVWDGFCAEEAAKICTLFVNCPGEGDCFVGGSTPGCSDTNCCNDVCEVDAFCCEIIWDAICAATAVNVCGDGCTVDCPGGSTQENEPNCGLDGFGNPDDTVNGGCNSDPPVFSSIVCGETVCGTVEYDATTENRDTDWYELTLATDTLVTWTVTAEFPVVVAIVDNDGTGVCPDEVEFLAATVVGPCVEGSVTRCLPPGTWWLFVAPEFISAVPCGTPYVATVTCSTPCEVPQCGDAGSGDCLEANGTPFCDDAECCETVCAIDAFCCAFEWDDVCANQADALCNLEPVENDDCATAAVLADGDTDFTTLGATIGDPLLPTQCSGSQTNQLYGPDVWFRYTPSCTGTLELSTCQQADFDTGIAVYTGTCDDLVFVDCVDDTLGCGITSRVVLDVECDVEYFVRVYGSFPDDLGSGTLTVECTGTSCAPCAPDLTGDGIVDGADLGLLLGSWGECPGCDADLDGNGIVDGADLGLLLGGWGACP